MKLANAVLIILKSLRRLLFYCSCVKKGESTTRISTRFSNVNRYSLETGLFFGSVLTRQELFLNPRVALAPDVMLVSNCILHEARQPLLVLGGYGDIETGKARPNYRGSSVLALLHVKPFM